MNGKNIIIVGLQSWDIEIGSNCKNIALELAKSNRVLYVNRALDIASILKRDKEKMTKARWQKYLSQKDGLTFILTNLWCLNPMTILFSVNKLPAFLFRIFNKINNRRLAKQIRLAAQKLNFDNYILFIDNDFFRAQYLAELIKPTISIYYIRDYLIQQTYFRKHGQDAEKSLILKSDLIVTNSNYLAEYASKFNPNAYSIGQGCDFSSFGDIKNFTYPKEFEGLNSTVIGYVGVLSSKRLDINLLTGLAKLLPECYIMLVGPEDDAFKKSELHKIENVIFTGSKTPLELPSYINSFDICINPQLINELTIGNYPRKIDEYLILGKPIVATSTHFMKYFEKYVFLCDDLDGYIRAINKLINQKEEQVVKIERISFAKQHTWEKSVNRLSEYYEFSLKNLNKNCKHDF